MPTIGVGAKAIGRKEYVMEKDKTVAASEAQAAERAKKPAFSDDKSVVAWGFIDIKIGTDGRARPEVKKLNAGGAADAEAFIGMLQGMRTNTIPMRNKDGQDYGIVTFCVTPSA